MLRHPTVRSWTFAAVTALAVSVPAIVRPQALPPSESILLDGARMPDAATGARWWETVRSAYAPRLLGRAGAGASGFIVREPTDSGSRVRVRQTSGAVADLAMPSVRWQEIIPGPQGARLSLLRGDIRGRENAFYLFDPSSGETTRITADGLRFGYPVWDRTGGRIAFDQSAAGGRDELWVMPVNDPGAARRVLVAPRTASWGVADWTADGSALIVEEFVSTTDNRIHVLSLENGSMRPLGGGMVRDLNIPLLAGALAHDDSGVFAVGDPNGAGRRLMWAPLDGSPAEELFPHLPVERFVLCPNRQHAALVANEDGADALYVFDIRRRSLKKVRGLPVGLVETISFSADATEMALLLRSVSQPGALYAVKDLAEPTAIPLRGQGEAPADSLDTELVNIPTFDSATEGSRLIPAFVMGRARRAKPAAVIVYLHGGPESQYRPAFSPTFTLWSREFGAVIIAPNVRGSSGYGAEYLALDDGLKRGDVLRDVEAVLEWIGRQPDLDATRVVLYGGSYGGWLALAAGSRLGPRVHGLISYSGMTDLPAFLARTATPDKRRQEYGDERDPQMRSFLESLGPLSRVGAISAPALIIHGGADVEVPVAQADDFVAAARRTGLSVGYVRAAAEGHVFRSADAQRAAFLAMTAFLSERLGPR